MNNKDPFRRAATLIDHTVISQGHCVYCGDTKIKPGLFGSGDTRHLDHFIPIAVIMAAKAASSDPRLRLPNFLLPCCTRCNTLAGQYCFASFTTKFQYMRARLKQAGANQIWEITDNQEYERLAAVRAPETVLSFIRPIEELEYGDGDIILGPQLGKNGHWITSQSCERVLQPSWFEAWVAIGYEDDAEVCEQDFPCCAFTLTNTSSLAGEWPMREFIGR